MTLRLTIALGLGAALMLTACAANEGPSTASSPTGSTVGEASLTGTLNGMGASSVSVAQENWIARFQTTNPDVTVLYSPDGSGAGRDAFVGGGADFAGSDRAFEADENVAGAFKSCAADSKALDLPIYISPIAVVFNIEGVESLNLTPDVLAAIFKGDITTWSDPMIAAINPDATLPDLVITAVHRSDNSGTTDNFTTYLSNAAGTVWDAEPDGAWPYQRGEAAKGTSGVISAVGDGVGTIGYADASQAGQTLVASIGTEGNFQPPTAEAAAAAVEASPVEEGRDEHDLALALDSAASGYPIVLVSYMLACTDYEDDAKADLVKAYLGYIASEEGQQVAADGAGAAPLSDALRGQVLASIESIQ